MTVRQMEALLAEVKERLADIEDVCLCLDPPGEDETDDEQHRTDYANPDHHQSYCPIQLYHYLNQKLKTIGL